MNRKTLLATILLGACAPLGAEASVPVSLNAQTLNLSLHEAIHIGLRDNRTVRSAHLQRIAEKFELRVIENRFAPQLVLSSRYLAQRGNDDRFREQEIGPSVTLLSEWGTRLSLSVNTQLNRAHQAGQRQNQGLGLHLVQPLLKDAGREINTAPVRLARLTEQANRLKLKASLAEVVTHIIGAYREVLKAQEQLSIARHGRERAEQLLEVNRALIASGRMAEFDIVQTEADMANQELTVEEAANQLHASRLKLLQLLALDLSTSIHASDRLQGQPLTLDQRQAVRIAMEQQPTYLSQLIQGQQTAINLLLAKNQRLWDLSLLGGARQSRDRFTHPQGNDTQRSWQGYVGLQLDIPIGDLSLKQSQIRAQVAVDDHALRLADARQALEREINDGVRNLGTRWRQYGIAQRAEALSLRKLEIERDKLRVGRSSNFQVLSYEADLRDAQNTRLNALITYLNTQTHLDQQLGITLEQWGITLND